MTNNIPVPEPTDTGIYLLRSKSVGSREAGPWRVCYVRTVWLPRSCACCKKRQHYTFEFRLMGNEYDPAEWTPCDYNEGWMEWLKIELPEHVGDIDHGEREFRCQGRTR